MEEIVSLPPMEFFNDNYQLVLDFIESLGNPKFKIVGNVDLEKNKTITSLGNLVEVDGSLYLSFTNITSLPDNLKVRLYFDLSYTNITSLPDNLKVGEALHLHSTQITSLPDNLKVGGSLFLGNTPLSRKYSSEEIRKMIEDKGGYVKKIIYV